MLLNVLELRAIEEPELEKRLGKEYLEYNKKSTEHNSSFLTGNMSFNVSFRSTVLPRYPKSTCY